MMELKEIEGVKYLRFDSKFELFRYRFGIFVSIFLIVFLLVFGSFTAYYLISNKEAFYSNPCTYCAERMKASCTCFTEMGLGIPFIFNSTSFGSYVNNNGEEEKFNISKLENMLKK